MNHPDIAIINFSDLTDADVQRAVRSINRQVVEDFMPIWGSAYFCKLHASPFDPGTPNEIQDDPAQAEGVVYLVNEASVSGAARLSRPQQCGGSGGLRVHKLARLDRDPVA